MHDDNTVDSSFKFVKETIFHYPLQHQKDLVKTFIKMDEIIWNSITTLVRVSKFVEQQLSENIFNIVAGITHRKNIFDKARGDLEVQEPSEHLDKGHIEFIQDSVSILKLVSMKKKHVSYQKNLELIKRLDFIRVIFEEIVDTFTTQVENYLSFSLQATILHNKLLEKFDLKTSKEYTELNQKMLQIEELVGIDRRYLYNVCAVLAQNVGLYNELRESIVKSYLRVVFTIAKRCSYSEQHLIDNFQNGTLGLMRAISCYCMTRNTKFTTYARWWINQSIKLALKEEFSLVKIPVCLWNTWNWLEKEKTKIVDQEISESKSSEEPKISNVRLSKHTGVSEDRISFIYDSIENTQFASLDSEVVEGSKMNLSGIIEDTRITEAEDERSLVQDTKKYLDSLNELERKVICMNYGLFDLLLEKAISHTALQREKLKQLSFSLL